MKATSLSFKSKKEGRNYSALDSNKEIRHILTTINFLSNIVKQIKKIKIFNDNDNI
jgi:hypothetical protein